MNLIDLLPQAQSSFHHDRSQCSFFPSPIGTSFIDSLAMVSLPINFFNLFISASFSVDGSLSEPERASFPPSMNFPFQLFIYRTRSDSGCTCDTAQPWRCSCSWIRGLTNYAYLLLWLPRSSPHARSSPPSWYYGI